MLSELWLKSQLRAEASLVAQTVKCLPAMWETWIRSLNREYPLKKEMATHSSTLAWRIPWTEEPGGLWSMGWQRVRHDWATSLILSWRGRWWGRSINLGPGESWVKLSVWVPPSSMTLYESLMLLALDSSSLTWKQKSSLSPANVLSRVRLLVTSQTVAHLAPLSMGFSRQEYWSGLPCPPPGDLPDSGIKPKSLHWQADSLLLSNQRSPSLSPA